MNKMNTFRRVERLARSTTIQKPGWYDAALLIPPHRKPFRIAAPKRIVYREDGLLRSFHQKLRGQEYKYLHLQGAESEGPAVAFVRRQLEVMQTQSLPERDAFNVVQKEAMETGSIHDAAVNLAVTNVEDRQKMLDEMVIDEDDVFYKDHVKEVSANVTEAFIADAMQLDNLSREGAETRAVKQRSQERRQYYEAYSRSQNQQQQEDQQQSSRQLPRQQGDGQRNQQQRPNVFSDSLKVAPKRTTMPPTSKE